MSSVGIFVFGVVVTTIVIAACWLIAWGIVTERRDRLRTESEQHDAAAARAPGPENAKPATPSAA